MSRYQIVDVQGRPFGQPLESEAEAWEEVDRIDLLWCIAIHALPLTVVTVEGPAG